MKRLYVGVFNLTQQIGSTQNVMTEIYVDWKDSAEAEKGEWIGEAMGKHPGFGVVGAFVDDVTDIARNEP